MSAEYTVRPCSIASAATGASVTRRGFGVQALSQASQSSTCCQASGGVRGRADARETRADSDERCETQPGERHAARSAQLLGEPGGRPCGGEDFERRRRTTVRRFRRSRSTAARESGGDLDLRLDPLSLDRQGRTPYIALGSWAARVMRGVVSALRASSEITWRWFFLSARQFLHGLRDIVGNVERWTRPSSRPPRI